MAGSGNSGKGHRAFQIDLLRAALQIGFVMVESAQAAYRSGEAFKGGKSLEAAQDAFRDASRVFSGLSRPGTSDISALAELREAIETTERFARREMVRVRLVYN